MEGTAHPRFRRPLTADVGSRRMKRAIPILLGLTLAFWCGCEDDNHDAKDPVAPTNAPSEDQPEPKPDVPQFCFPTNYLVPQPPVDGTNTTVTITTTIGTPGDPFYQVTTKAVIYNSAKYTDNTQSSSEKTTIDDTTVSSGTTNVTQSMNHSVSIILFDNTKLTSDLVEHSTHGIQDQRQYSAFLECSDGKVTPITEVQFNSFKTQIGL